jgi:intron-binding protein aquarius
VELRPAFDLLLQRPDKLMLVTGELCPSERLVASESEAVEGEVAMESVEHIGQYVFEMTKTKMQQLQEEETSAGYEIIGEEADEGTGGYYGPEDGQEDEDAQADVEEAP